MKVIIAGSRGIVDATVISRVVKYSNFQITEIVSGTARGVDSLAVDYAKENNIQLKEFPADWTSSPRGAGHIRNAEMAKYADALIAIWDGVSNGTRNMIETMKKKNKPVYVFTIAEFQPVNDGVDHVNVYTKAETLLGRMLSNISNYGFTHPEYGYFATMEGYWYWLSTGKTMDFFRNIPAMSAKLIGKKLPKVTYPQFEEDILYGLELKLKANPEILVALLDSKLPLTHYYYFGKPENPKVIRTKGSEFVVGYFESIRQGTRHVR